MNDGHALGDLHSKLVIIARSTGLLFCFESGRFSFLYSLAVFLLSTWFSFSFCYFVFVVCVAFANGLNFPPSC